MKIFETLRTAFRVLIAKTTEDRLFYIGLAFVGIMLIWSILSIVFNAEKKYRKSCIAIIQFLRKNTLTSDNYHDFTLLWKNFPSSMRRSWKRYETKRAGIPSDYISQGECFDTYFNGGIFKQNRSIMKVVIYFVIAFLTMVSIAIIGNENSGATSTAFVTTVIIADSLIVPLVIYLCSMCIYYMYTAIRHFDYRATADTFHDLIDVLDEKVDLKSVFSGDTASIGLLSEIYENDTVSELRRNAKYASRNGENIQEVKKGGNGLSPAKSGILGEKEIEREANYVLETNTLEPKKLSDDNKNDSLEIQEKQYTIMNEQQFVSLMSNVEALISKAKIEKQEEKRIAIEKEINQKLKALTEYKQKVKETKKVEKNAKKNAV